MGKEFTSVPVQADDPDSATVISNASRIRVDLGQVFELTADTWRSLPVRSGEKDSIGRLSFPAVTLEVPQQAGEGLNLMLLTSITVFGSIVMGEYESQLTCPTVLRDLGRIGRGAQLEFSYSISERPGFTYRQL
jgi:hypothetical protein